MDVFGRSGKSFDDMVCESTNFLEEDGDSEMWMLPFLLIGLMAAFQMSRTQADSCGRIVCYQSHWYRLNSSDKFTPDNIDPSMCTHLVYAFTYFSSNNLDPFDWHSDAEWTEVMHIKVLNLKRRNPSLKILLNIGGLLPSSTSFTRIMTSAIDRQYFFNNTINCLRMRGFDGLDLDLNLRDISRNPSIDKQGFSDLIKDLKLAFAREAASSGKSRLLLSAIVSARKNIIDAVFDVPTFSQELDLFNVLAFNLNGYWENVTSHNSPLYSRSVETGNQLYVNVDFAARYWVEKGADKSKLNLGLTLYGSTYTLADPANYQLGAPSSSHGKGGLVGYFEVCELLKAGGQMVYNSEQRAPFAHLDDQWVSYENTDSLREKVRYVKDNNFGGVMVWALDLDDFKGSHCGQTQYPLMKAIIDGCWGTVVPLTTPGTVDKTFCIKRKSGPYADPSDCVNFITCSNGFIHKSKCSNGTAWNDTIKTCDHATYASCDHSAP